MLAKLGKARFHWKYVRLPLELSCLLGMHRFLQFSWSLELFEASSSLWNFPATALDSSLNAGEMDSRLFEGIRGDSGERPGPMLHWPKQAQFRGKRPPKSACKRPPQGQKKPDFEGANISTSAFAGTGSPPCLGLASKQAPLDCEHLQTAQLGSACHHEKF